MAVQEKVLGQSIVRVDAESKVTGRAAYPGDLSREEALFMKVVFSEKTHARVVSIDTSAAEAVPGVAAVFTAKDIAANEYGLVITDQPVLSGPGSQKPGTDIVRTLMDNVALVVADTEETANEAVKLLDIQYEELPSVFDPYEAMQDDAPRLHADTERNIVSQYHVRHGDMEKGWAEADVVVEGYYTTIWQEHAYLQPEAGLAYIDEEGRVTVEIAGQHAHKDRQQVAHALGLEEDQVRIIYPAIGGAFGGREDMSLQITLALAAWRLKRPVFTLWSREESITGHHKRHPINLKVKWGAKKDGTLTAVKAEIVGDAGAYNYTSNKVLGNATLMSCGPYYVPNVQVDTYAVYTNNIPCGAFRGFGGPQAAFAAEGQINKLAEKLGLDPVEIRLKNALKDGDITMTGTPPPPNVTIYQVMDECAKQGEWSSYKKPDKLPTHKRRGVGFAASFKNIGFSFGYPEKCYATIEMHGGADVERVILRHAAADVGQGAHTALKQIAADAVGVPVELVEIDMSDTATSEDSGSASASRMTFMAGNAVIGAAEKALAAWEQEERPAVGFFKYVPPATTTLDPETGYGTPNFAYGYVAEIIEVEVDIETGELDVINVVCANDVGRAVNPTLIEGQIEGAIVQAHGYAIMENFKVEKGRVITSGLETYIIPSVRDIPRNVKSIILELGDTVGPYGIRGMAEMPFMPYAPALAAAIHDATGVWIDDLPFTPDRVVAKLREAGIGG